MENEEPPSVEDTVDRASEFLINLGEEFMSVNDLYQPGFSGCNQCPLRPRGDPDNPHYIPSKCPAYEKDRHCILEEAMVIDTVQTLEREGIQELDKFMLFSLLVNQLNLFRLSRAGQVINFANIHIDKESAEIVNKYISMTSSTNIQFTKALKELRATKKERESGQKREKTTSNAAYVLSKNISKAEEMEEAELEDDETNGSSRTY